MKRYIYEIQYNESDSKKLYDKVFVDATNRYDASKKLKKQFPGIYRSTFLMTHDLD